MFKNIDELQLSQLSNWFVSLLKEKSLPCREAFLVSLIRLHRLLRLFQDLISVVIKTAIEFKRLGQLGHHPSTVVFAFALLGSLRVKSTDPLPVLTRVPDLGHCVIIHGDSQDKIQPSGELDWVFSNSRKDSSIS